MPKYLQVKLDAFKVGEVIAWLVLTKCYNVSVFDIGGQLEKQSDLIGRVVKRELETVINRNNKDSVEIKENKIKKQKGNVIRIKIKAKQGSENIVTNVKIVFLNSVHNNMELLEAVCKTAKEKLSKNQTKSSDKKRDFVALEKDLHSKLECYKHFTHNKEISSNP